MDWKFELAEIPVSDIERAKTFYAEQIGFNVDIDHSYSETSRFVQLTPPGSASSINLGMGMTDAPPGSSQGLVLVVEDVATARAELAERGVEVGEIQVFDSGEFRTSREGDDLNLVGFIFFSDPDGNGWAVQQIASRV